MTTTLLEYLCKVSVSLTLLYLFYYVGLRKLTCYTWNRWYLLLYAILSFFIPLMNVTRWLSPRHAAAIYFIHPLPSFSYYPHSKWTAAPTDLLWNYQQWLLLIFIVGALFFFLRLLLQIRSLLRLQAKAILWQDGAIKLYHLEENILPFCFLSSIYLNKNHHSETELQEIIDHEMVHVRQKHTWDVLMAEIICMLNWFNPFAWFIKRAIKENLEFIADEQVLFTGVNKKHYQYHLLKVMGYAPATISSGFNFPSIKKRIAMMNKARTGKRHLLKFLFMIPLIGFLLLAFRTARDNGKATVAARKGEASNEESFRLTTLTYYSRNQQVAVLVKKEQDKSLLKPGDLLSLSLLQQESNRLKNLLQQHGFDPITDHTITFLMDSSLTSKSFSVQVMIDVPEERDITRAAGSSAAKELSPVTSEDSPYTPIVANKGNSGTPTANDGTHLNKEIQMNGTLGENKKVQTVTFKE